ncbi:hypothetical protein ACFLTE_06715, partial [Bacteroidota bacterium]
MAYSFNINKILINSLNLLLFTLSVFILILPAISNGYPIIHPDVGTYIASGFKKFIPIDRPISYGLFIRLMSLAHSLWLVIIMQSILFVLTLIIIFNYVIKTNFVMLKVFITIILLCLTTGLAVYTSVILPDIFSSISILCLIFFITYDKVPKSIIVFMCILYIYTNISHLSNFTSSSIIVVSIIILSLLFRKLKQFNLLNKKLILIVSLIVLCWLIQPLINYNYSGSFKTYKPTYILVTANLIQSNILIEFLEENCDKQEYDLCQYLDELNGEFKRPPTFVWNHNSPLYKGGCLEKNWTNCWYEKNEAYKLIILDMFKEPKYIIKLLKNTIKNTSKQLYTINLSTYSPMLKGSAQHFNIGKFFKRELYQYESAKQSERTLKFKILNKI